MKTALATLFAILFLSGAAFAQTSCLSQNATAVPIDTVQATIALAPATETPRGDTSTSIDGGTYKTGTTGIIVDLVYFRVGDRIECGVTAESIRFNGIDPDKIDSLSTMELFNLISQVALGQALNNGYTGCSNTCRNTFRVNLPACVERNGRGLETRFSSCRPGYCCTRIYSLCCPDGSTSPVVKLIGTENGGDCAGVGPTCQSTCP